MAKPALPWQDLNLYRLRWPLVQSPVDGMLVEAAPDGDGAEWVSIPVPRHRATCPIAQPNFSVLPPTAAL